MSGRTGAVERNRIRRRLRAAAVTALHDHPGFDVLVYARASVPEPPFPRLVEAIMRAMTQAAARAQR